MAVYSYWVPAMLIDGAPEQLLAEHASASFFDTLGIRPALGRSFTDQDDQPGRNDVVILSDGFWASRFARDPAVIGTKILLDNAPYTIVGIMPPGFVPPNIDHGRRPVSLWRPLAEREAENRSARYVRVIARLKPGINLDLARAQMNDLARRLGGLYKEDAGLETQIDHLDVAITGGFARTLWTLLAAAGLLLLIACANIASLLLARTTARRQEFATRAALGCGRARLFRQVLTESLLLSACGGVLAILLAFWAKDVLAVAAKTFLPGSPATRLDLNVYLFAGLISVLVGLALGSIQAFHAALTDIGEDLARTRHTTTRQAARIRSALMIGELAVTLVLLTGAWLLLSSLRQVQSLDLGFRAEHVLIGDVRMRRGQTEDPANLLFMTELVDRVKRLPGVQSAAVADAPPLSGRGDEQPFLIEGRTAVEPADQRAAINTCTPEYFHLLEMRLIRGRLFGSHDGLNTPQVVLVNQAFARMYFRDDTPIGRRIKLITSLEWQTIIGIIADVRQTSITAEPIPQIYFPYAQHPLSRMALVVRASGDPAALSGAIRREMSHMHPNVPLAGAQTIDDLVSDVLAPRRFSTLLLASYAALAILLAVVGVYAVTSYSIAERTREIGVRIALGARPRDVVSLIVRERSLIAGVGLSAGLILSLIFGRVLQTLLYGVTAHDPGTLSAAAVLLAAVVLSAIVIPAAKAARLDPVVALRRE